MGIVTDCEFGRNAPMARSITDVARRLVATQQALGISPAALCKESGISATQWSQFTDPAYKRRITLAAAYKLKDSFGITLEWIFDGDRTRLPYDIALKLREAA
jgi:transcriptional regulator with XRE-family HTH domain